MMRIWGRKNIYSIFKNDTTKCEGVTFQTTPAAFSSDMRCIPVTCSTIYAIHICILESHELAVLLDE